MRLDKFTIGSAKPSPTHQFKNLKNVTIDFDEGHWVTVMIGWNGTGKSNVLEALVIIFRELIYSKKPSPGFAFNLAYRMGTGKDTRHISIHYDPDHAKEPFTIHVASHTDIEQTRKSPAPLLFQEENVPPPGKRIKLSTFLANSKLNLPRYIFSYYSGDSTRMHEVFRPYLEDYDNKLRKGEDPGLKRLFYAMPVHSQFVLLAFLIQQTDIVCEFLDNHLGLDPEEGIESVLFVLRQPPWKSKAGDPRFWYAKGVVSEFLSRLYDIALAPIKIKRRVPVSLWNQETLEFQYLYVKDIESLRQLVGKDTPAKFFRNLESTYVSELIEEVRIRVRLKKNDGSVTFRELSEGEQQLLTVLGLLRFTSEDESLFLLDEPDTHLNPRWCADYLKYLQDFIGADDKGSETSHIIFTTHNPLAIAELVKQQVQILNRDKDSGQIEARKPEFDPRGMGYAGIVTSDMFGLASSLDSHTQDLLEEKRVLTLNNEPLSDMQRNRLETINLELESYGFRYSMRDPLYEEYLRARYRFDEDQPEDKKMKSRPSTERRLKAKELIQKAAQKIREEQSKVTDETY